MSLPLKHSVWNAGSGCHDIAANCLRKVKFCLLASALPVSRSMDLYFVHQKMSKVWRTWDLGLLYSCDKLSFPYFRSSASSFSSQYLLLFLKSSRSCVLLFLPISFTSVICPSMASSRRQFLLRI